jgi:NAD+ kinase
MNIAIFGRITTSTKPSILFAYFNFLREQQITFKILASYAIKLNEQINNPEERISLAETFENTQDLSTVDFVLSIGGDGTLLETVRQFRGSGTPVLGVNTGRLGFLAQVVQEDLIPATHALLKGTFKLEERTIMQLITSDTNLFPGDHFALNDITIHKSNSNEMITVHTFINGDFLNAYWGDGIILSTPTGSTAYNLSCGGPVIMPGTPAFVITPIAPHSLTIRPMIIPDHSVISLEIESRSGQALIALDSRTQVIHHKTEIAVRKATFTMPLVRIQQYSYFESLRTRLHWGLDNRN